MVGEPGLVSGFVSYPGEALTRVMRMDREEGEAQGTCIRGSCHFLPHAVRQETMRLLFFPSSCALALAEQNTLTVNIMDKYR